VILPEVFRSVERKLSTTMDYRPFEDDDLSSATRGLSPRADGKYQTRTTVAVSVLAGVITVSYMLRGLMGLVFTCVQGMVRERSWTTGLEAAEEEVGRNEERLRRLSGGDKVERNEGE